MKKLLFHRFLPRQSSLTIYNSSQLYINLEGCVNTLRGECLTFLRTHGKSQSFDINIKNVCANGT